MRDEDLGAELHVDSDALWAGRLDAALDDLASERAEDDHSELGCVGLVYVGLERMNGVRITIDVDKSGSRADETLGCGNEIPKVEADANVGDDLVAVLFVDRIFDGLATGL